MPGLRPLLINPYRSEKTETCLRIVAGAPMRFRMPTQTRAGPVRTGGKRMVIDRILPIRTIQVPLRHPLTCTGNLMSHHRMPMGMLRNLDPRSIHRTNTHNMRRLRLRTPLVPVRCRNLDILTHEHLSGRCRRTPAV